MSIWVLGLGALAGLDRTAFGQTLLAHPLVVGTVTALVAGAPGEAVLLLGVLACLDAPQIPVQGARLPDTTSAAVVGVIAGTSAPTPAGWAVALVGALATGVFGGWSIVGLRAVCERNMGRADRALASGSVRRLEALHLVLTSLGALRGAIVVGLGLLLVGWLQRGAAILPDGHWMLSWLEGIWWLAPWAALPVLCRLHWRGQRRRLVGLSVLSGAFLYWGLVVGGGVG